MLKELFPGSTVAIFKIPQISKYFSAMLNTQFYRIRALGGAGWPATNIFFNLHELSQQIMYCWKRNLSEKRIHFKYLKNILISRFYG